MGIKNRVTKYDLYEIIRSKSEILEFLPPTQLLNDFNRMVEFVDQYERIILKPLNCFVNERTYIIEKLESNFRIIDCRKEKNIKFILKSYEELKEYLKKNEIDFKDYFIQKFIKLDKFDESSFDVRVIMKKITEDKWNMDGMECKVGKNSFLITNIFKEGLSPLNKVMEKYYPLKFNFSEKVAEINKVCLEACNIIDDFIEDAETLSFDIGIDENKKVWIMEMNMLGSLKRFFVVDYRTYLSIKYTPLLYKVSLYNCKNK